MVNNEIFEDGNYKSEYYNIIEEIYNKIQETINCPNNLYNKEDYELLLENIYYDDIKYENIRNLDENNIIYNNIKQKCIDNYQNYG